MADPRFVRAPPGDRHRARVLPPPSRAAMVIDCVVLQSSDARTPARPHAPPATEAPVGGMELLNGPPRETVGGLRARGGPIFWLFGLGLAAASFWVSGGHALFLDALTPEAPHGGVRIATVTSRVDASGAHPVLLVDGEAMRDGDAISASPSLQVDVEGADGVVTRYLVATIPGEVGERGNFSFSGRFRAPTSGVRTVSVAVAE